MLTGRGAGGHSEGLILEIQVLPGQLGHHVATNTENSQVKVSLAERVADVGSLPAIRATDLSGGLQLPSSALQNAPVVPGLKVPPTGGAQDTFQCKCRILTGHLALFPNPLYPHVHNNHHVLFCRSSAYSRAFRDTSVELLQV